MEPGFSVSGGVVQLNLFFGSLIYKDFSQLGFLEFITYSDSGA